MLSKPAKQWKLLYRKYFCRLVSEIDRFDETFTPYMVGKKKHKIDVWSLSSGDICCQ